MKSKYPKKGYENTEDV